MDRPVRGGRALIALLIGALIGVVMGLFFSPQSGEEARETIREKASDLKDRAAESLDHLRDRI